MSVGLLIVHLVMVLWAAGLGWIDLTCPTRENKETKKEPLSLGKTVSELITTQFIQTSEWRNTQKK